MTANTKIQCMSCGTIRLALTAGSGRVDTGECMACLSVGWALPNARSTPFPSHLSPRASWSRPLALRDTAIAA
jgi:hypothetical protein